MGALESNQNDFKSELKEINKKIKENPDDIELYIKRASIYGKHDKPEKAKKDTKKYFDKLYQDLPYDKVCTDSLSI